MPDFDLTGALLAVALSRALFVSALFSGYGTLVLLTWVAPRSAERPLAVSPTRGLERLAQASLACAIVMGIVWLVLETAELGGTGALRTIAATVPVVLAGTRFGHIVGLQMLALAAGLTMLRAGPGRFRRAGGLGGALAATILQAGHGHALAMHDGPSLLLVSEGLHVMCGGAWLGALLPLLIFVRAASGRDAAAAARRFSPLGIVCVAGILVSAGFQAWSLIGGLPGFPGTAYGWTAMAKIVLFAVLLGFAAANRTRFVPALDGPDPVAGKRALLRSIGMETGTGFLVVIAAGILTSLPPAIHEQPVWPFTLQPSLTTIREDLDFRREVELAVAILLTAAGLFAAGLCVRRLRWPGIIGSVLLTWIAAPHLDLLFVQAYPTSFYNSATGFAADAIADGAALYPTHCAGCHGPDGKGDGPAAKGLALPPADLTAGHLWAHSDGEMFWWLTHGIDGPEGGLAMPGFGGVLSEDQRWSLIDYVRAHNIGLVFAASGAWSPPIQAPGFAALCARGNTIGLDDLRGKIVRLVFLGTKDAVVPSPTARIDGVDVVTIMAPARSGVALSDDAGCTIQDSATVQAYAIVAGVSPDAMSGSRFLIDGNGWLRGMSRPDGNPDAPNRDDTASLRAEIGRIIANPISASAGGHAHHH